MHHFKFQDAGRIVTRAEWGVFAAGVGACLLGAGVLVAAGWLYEYGHGGVELIKWVMGGLGLIGVGLVVLLVRERTVIDLTSGRVLKFTGIVVLFKPDEYNLRSFERITLGRQERTFRKNKIVAYPLCLESAPERALRLQLTEGVELEKITADAHELAKWLELPFEDRTFDSDQDAWTNKE